MINKIKLLKNVGKFVKVEQKQETFSKSTLIHADNGRGKTTLSDIFHSLSTNNPNIIKGRQSLASSTTPYIAITTTDENFIYKNGAWDSYLPEIAVFNDNFVAQNIYSGIEVDSDQRKNLHSLIIGAKGAELNNELLQQKEKIKNNSKTIKETEEQIKNIISDITKKTVFLLKSFVNYHQKRI